MQYSLAVKKPQKPKAKRTGAFQFMSGELPFELEAITQGSFQINFARSADQEVTFLLIYVGEEQTVGTLHYSRSWTKLLTKLEKTTDGIWVTGEVTSCLKARGKPSKHKVLSVWQVTIKRPYSGI